MRPQFFKVQDVWQETADVFTLKLKLSAELFKSMKPGQFNMLYSFGVGEVPISISRFEKNNTILHTIRDVGMVSHALVNVKVGDELGLRGPFGVGWPVDAALKKDLVIMAGGIGLAPLRPVIDFVIQNRSDFGNVVLLYGARLKKDLLFESEWIDWMQKGLIEMNVSLDQLDASDHWDGQVGVVTGMIDQASFDPRNAIAMICGPELMMRFSAQKLNDIGVLNENIFLSQERNMKCAIGLCGHCQYLGDFVCKTGPVFSFQKIKHLMLMREV
jgi:NAD(P)H-flavin reductase